jgi:hypothetical protein
MERSVGHDGLLKYRVAAGAKRSIRRELDRMGIDMEMLFPDQEGFSSHLNWVVHERRQAETAPAEHS